MTKIFTLWLPSNKEILRMTERIRLTREMLQRHQAQVGPPPPLLLMETQRRLLRGEEVRKLAGMRGERRVSCVINKLEEEPDANHKSSDSAEASEDSPGEDGEVKARPVSVANTTQCCGGLKSGVCTLI